jgi:hypothetical protein
MLIIGSYRDYQLALIYNRMCSNANETPLRTMIAVTAFVAVSGNLVLYL